MTKQILQLIQQMKFEPKLETIIMKRVFFTALLSVFVLSASAQKKVFKNAEKAFRKENYEEAAQYAKEASNHPDTQNEPDVYILLGDIEMVKFRASGKSDLDAAEAAYNYYAKAMELGDDKLREEMMEPPVIVQLPGQDEPSQSGGSETMALLERYMLLGGNEALDVDDSEKAFNFFRIATMINPSDMMNFFTGYAADGAGLKEEMVKYYSEVINSEADSVYENANFAFNGVIQYQLEQEAYDDALAIIRKAKETFPDIDLYKKWEVEVLIQNDMVDEAVAGLEQTIAGGSADVQTYTQLAFLHWQAENLEKAIEVGKEAVAKDGEYFDANYVLGGAMYDKAAATLRKAGDPSIDDDTYNKLKADAKEQFGAARPYWEKCLALKPDDSALYAPLSTIYEQLDMDVKRDEMLAKMDAAGGE